MDCRVMFEELRLASDQLGPSDWLIPREEVSSKRFLRQTASHNIYKADWFGDVLIYESRSAINDQKIDMKLRGKKQPLNPIELTLRLDSLRSQSSTNHQQQFSPLSPLCSPCASSISSSSPRNFVGLKRSRSQQSLGSCSSDCAFTNESSFDSAYSSITSTPLYNTKPTNNKISKFEFPINCQSSETATRTSELTSPVSWTRTSSSEESTCKSSENISYNNNNDSSTTISSKQQGPNRSSRLVILNKQSYSFSKSSRKTQEATNKNNNNEPRHEPRSSEIDWLELNKLRLIAHEGFMLFMGASLDCNTNEKLLGRDQSASLVIEMYHPKATSLHDLLHNVSASVINFHQVITSPSSTTTQRFDRFFQRQLRSNTLINQQQGSIFNFAEKLAICQQVINAMTYLHDKNICHGRLTSTNIYIEPNQTVKISLIDEHDTPLMLDNVQVSSAKPMIADVSSLTYLSPELIRTMDITCDNNEISSCRFDLSQLGKESDVFAFGTISYELFGEKFPFSKQGMQKTTLLPSPDELIYQIGSGKIADHNLVDCRLPNHIADLIAACWTTDVSMRPQFKQLKS